MPKHKTKQVAARILPDKSGEAENIPSSDGNTSTLKAANASSYLGIHQASHLLSLGSDVLENIFRWMSPYAVHVLIHCGGTTIPVVEFRQFQTKKVEAFKPLLKKVFCSRGYPEWDKPLTLSLKRLIFENTSDSVFKHKIEMEIKSEIQQMQIYRIENSRLEEFDCKLKKFGFQPLLDSPFRSSYARNGQDLKTKIQEEIDYQSDYSLTEEERIRNIVKGVRSIFARSEVTVPDTPNMIEAPEFQDYVKKCLGSLPKLIGIEQRACALVNAVAKIGIDASVDVLMKQDSNLLHYVRNQSGRFDSQASLEAYISRSRQALFWNTKSVKERRSELILTMESHGITLRDYQMEHTKCKNFINWKYGTIDEIVNLFLEEKWIRTHTIYNNIQQNSKIDNPYLKEDQHIPSASLFTSQKALIKALEHFIDERISRGVFTPFSSEINPQPPKSLLKKLDIIISDRLTSIARVELT
ncbi:hypothetical protein HK096_006485, partial [Nowakowskiella sp. JEL0078]